MKILQEIMPLYKQFLDIKNPIFYKIGIMLDATPVEVMLFIPFFFFFLYNYSRKVAFYYALIITSLFSIISINIYDWFTAIVVGLFPIFCFMELFFAWLEYSPFAEKRIIKLLSKEGLTNRELDLLYQLNLKRKPLYLGKIRKIINFGIDADYISKIDEKLMNEQLDSIVKSIKNDFRE